MKPITHHQFCLVGQHVIISDPAKLVINLLHDSTLSFAPPVKENRSAPRKIG